MEIQIDFHYIIFQMFYRRCYYFIANYSKSVFLLISVNIIVTPIVSNSGIRFASFGKMTSFITQRQ